MAPVCPASASPHGGSTRPTVKIPKRVVLPVPAVDPGGQDGRLPAEPEVRCGGCQGVLSLKRSKPTALPEDNHAGAVRRIAPCGA